MNTREQKRFDKLYSQHVRALKLYGYADTTIDVYSRAVRRLAKHFDGVPDKLSIEQLTAYFSSLVDSHSWSTVKVDRNGLQFFWEHILKRDWSWVDIIKPPTVRTLPDVLTVAEVERLILATRQLRYRVFILATYSMGLRLSETLSLQISDIDAKRRRVHIRRGKGCKDRFVPLPDLTYLALRMLWAKHRNPKLLFPNPHKSAGGVHKAKQPMNRGGTQKAFQVIVQACGVKKRFRSTAFAIALPPIYSNRV